MKTFKIALLVALSVTSLDAFALRVKGLEIGSFTTHKALAKIFGNAICPTEKAILAAHAKNRAVSCDVPISYLGIKTSASVSISEHWQVNSLHIKIPEELRDKVIESLTELYGPPTAPYEPPAKVVGPDGNTTWKMEEFAHWENVGGAEIFAASRFVSYRIAKSKALDTSDI